MRDRKGDDKSGGEGNENRPDMGSGGSVATKRQVLMVSKAVVPPWNDSSKNLVRDIQGALQRYRGTTMVPQSVSATPDTLPVYAPRQGSFAPALVDNARVLAALLRDSRHALWHFFFAPNPKSGLAGHLATRWKGRPTVHTVCSAPLSLRGWRKSFFADAITVLSEHSERRLLAAGIPRDRVHRIPPALRGPNPLSPEERIAARRAFNLPLDAQIVVYAGDLEFGGGALATIEACRTLEVTLVMACRQKTAAAKEVEASLRRKDPSVLWVGETSAIHQLLGCADLVALPSHDLYAKMDYPLVLLEAMAMERPVVVGGGTPAAELVDGGALVASLDTERLAHTITQGLREASTRGPQGAAYVRQEFAPEAVAARYEALYDALL